MKMRSVAHNKRPAPIMHMDKKDELRHHLIAEWL